MDIICSYSLLIIFQSYLCTSIFTEDTMIKALDSFAIGYDAKNDTILLLGGDLTTQQLTLFQPLGSNFVDRGDIFLEHASYGIGQHYTQLMTHDALWMVYLNTLIKMDLKTYSTSLAPTNLPSAVGVYGCLTSFDDYLIVIGSGPSTIWRTADIYHITTNVWLSNVPLLQLKRRALPCAVVNNKAYAIGGWSGSRALNTIEVLDISNIYSDSFPAWTYFNDVLSTGRFAGRSVVYGTDIYVIGGSAVQAGTALTDVGIIDTVSGQYYDISDSLKYRVTLSSSIIVGNTLYVFGGWDQTTASTESRYQYLVLPTPNPTKSPTNIPTLSPTKPPTKAPSKSPTSTTLLPTNMPTSTPSRSPTPSPSLPPSNMPSSFPTLLPTSSPTLIPTKIPTVSPTIPPTLIPSSSPTLLPTSSPTALPSNAPSDLPTLSPTSPPSLDSLPPSYYPSIEPTTAAPVITTIADGLKDGRVDEVNNTKDNKSRNTQSTSGVNDNPAIKRIIFAVIALVLILVICVLLRVLYKRDANKNAAQVIRKSMEMSEADHRNTIDDKDVMAPGIGLHHGSVDVHVQQPGMALDKDSNSLEKKRILMTRRVLAGEIVATNMNGGEMEGGQQEQNVKTVEGAQDVTKVTKLPPQPLARRSDDTQHVQTTKDITNHGGDV